MTERKSILVTGGAGFLGRTFASVYWQTAMTFSASTISSQGANKVSSICWAIRYSS
jgi:dTDP-D-glucose 4,6-dehydratase